MPCRPVPCGPAPAQRRAAQRRAVHTAEPRLRALAAAVRRDGAAEPPLCCRSSLLGTVGHIFLGIRVERHRRVHSLGPRAKGAARRRNRRAGAGRKRKPGHMDGSGGVVERDAERPSVGQVVRDRVLCDMWRPPIEQPEPGDGIGTAGGRSFGGVGRHGFSCAISRRAACRCACACGGCRPDLPTAKNMKHSMHHPDGPRD